ncbi:hypothetical protein ACJJTC_018922 [Scirpophaga incertulas]
MERNLHAVLCRAHFLTPYKFYKCLDKHKNALGSARNRRVPAVALPLSVSDIDYIHRVRRYPRPSTSKDGLPDAKSPDMSNIIVRFTQRSKKNDLLAAVRARRGLYTSDLDIDGPASVVFVNDHLAPHNKILYSQVRTMGRSKGYKYIWINDCKIFLRKNDTSKAIHISNSDDLSKIK